MIKVSVVIPVYGVQEYIVRCAKSLFSQTLKDMQFIFVDDCTKDKSIDLLERLLLDYPERAAAVKIIHHNYNMGLPYARETGARIAEGEYIAHCDSDDYVELDMYENMYRVAKEGNYDMVVCDAVRESDDGVVQLTNPLSDSKWAFFTGLMRKTNQPMVWNKLYKKELDKLIVYPKYGMGEDLVTSIQISYYANSIGFSKKSFYHYCWNRQSMSSSSSTEASVLNKFYQVVHNGEQLFSFLEKKGLSKKYSKEIVYSKLLKRNFLLPLIHIPNYYRKWLDSYPEIKGFVVFNTLIPIKERIRYIYYQYFYSCPK